MNSPQMLPKAAGMTDKQRRGLHEDVYHSLQHAILSGKYKVGERLPTESKLAETYAVSRPVLRQALDMLRDDGLISSRRGSGSFVRDADEIADVTRTANANASEQMGRLLYDLEFRAVLEPQAALLAAERYRLEDIDRMARALDSFEAAYEKNAITHHFDFLFHEALALATGNPQFVQAIRAIEYGGDAQLRLRYAIHFPQNKQGAQVLKEHIEVFRLIEARNGQGAYRAMADHIGAAKRRLSETMSQPRTGLEKARDT